MFAKGERAKTEVCSKPTVILTDSTTRQIAGARISQFNTRLRTTRVTAAHVSAEVDPSFGVR
jgi:hypothetical protein